jgi:hypothetical protein
VPQSKRDEHSDRTIATDNVKDEERTMSDSTRRTIFRVILGFVSGSNFLIGLLIMNAGPGAIAGLGRLYGASDVALTPQFLYIVKPLGAYMVTMGALGLAALRDPERDRNIVYGLGGVLLLRSVQRVVWGDEAQAAFGIPSGRMVAQTVFFLALSVSLFYLAPRRRSAGS